MMSGSASSCDISSTYLKLPDKNETLYCGDKVGAKSFFSRMGSQEHTLYAVGAEDLKRKSNCSFVNTYDSTQRSHMYSQSSENRSLLTYLSVSRLDGGGLTVKGCVIAAYCNVFLIIMAVFLLIGGILLTAIAFRPQEMREELGEWTDRFANISGSRIGGLVLVIVSLLLLSAGAVLVILNRMARKKESRGTLLTSPQWFEERRKAAESRDKSPDDVPPEASFTDKEGLISQTVACFPDKSRILRTSSSLLKKVSQQHHRRTHSLQTKWDSEATEPTVPRNKDKVVVRSKSISSPGGILIIDKNIVTIA